MLDNRIRNYYSLTTVNYCDSQTALSLVNVQYEDTASCGMGTGQYRIIAADCLAVMHRHKLVLKKANLQGQCLLSVE